MKFAYDKSKAQRIINHEDIMLKTYSKIISTYTSLFEQYDCSLKVRLFWIDFSTERRSNRRLPFRIGYACYVCCEVQRDGKEVQVKSADGEADYYSLSATWMVSSIERSFLKAKVSRYERIFSVVIERPIEYAICVAISAVMKLVIPCSQASPFGAKG